MPQTQEGGRVLGGWGLVVGTSFWHLPTCIKQQQHMVTRQQHENNAIRYIASSNAHFLHIFRLPSMYTQCTHPHRRTHTRTPIYSYTVHNSRAFATPNVGILTQPSSKSFALFDGAAKIKSIKNAQGTVRQGTKVGRRASVAGVTGQGGWPIGVCAREGRCD